MRTLSVAIRSRVMAGCLAIGVCMVGASATALGDVDDFTFAVTTPGSYVTWDKAAGPTGLAAQLSGMAFDPLNSDQLYYTKDANSVTGSGNDGIYALSVSTEVMSARLAAVVRPNDMVTDAAGNVYAVSDYTPLVTKVTDPSGAATTSVILGNYFGTGDDDPIGIDMIPAGFSGGGVSPGDLVIADRGIDDNAVDGVVGIGLGTNTPGALWMETVDTSIIGSLDAMASNPVDGKIYFSNNNPSAGGSSSVFRVGSSLVLETLAINMPGVDELVNIDAIAVNPVDGSIWFADDTLDQIYRVDSVTGNATLEIQMLGDGDTIPGVNFGENAMAFSPDGTMLAIGDIQFDEIHLFSIVPEPGTLGLLAIGAFTMLRRRRERFSI